MLNEVQIKFLNDKINKLSKNKFRGSFKLKEKDILYVKDKGIDVIREHAYRFIRERLAPSFIPNNGRQTPMSGHPVFIAQHATATCCRDCLYKWHHIEPNKELSEKEIRFIVELIIYWIELQIKRTNIN